MGALSITFYSYKGGVGRSLTTANMAGFLAQFGFRVLVVDFDLEAPGLHYKFGVPAESLGKGATHLLAHLSAGRLSREPDLDGIVDVGAPNSPGAVYLLPAGNATTPAYWNDLAEIRWDALFRHSSAGFNALDRFVADVSGKLDADFVLIDSRTGITISGGVATSMLSDVVVVLFLPSMEHVDGTASIVREAARAGGRLRRIVPVVARSSLEPGGAEEFDFVETLYARLRAGLPQESADLISRPLSIHSDPLLAAREFLVFGATSSPAASQRRVLLDDYVRLFSALTPEQFTGDRLRIVRNEVRLRMLDEPADVAKTLESLVAIVDSPEVFEDLIKFYTLTKDPASLVLACSRLWRIHSRVLVGDEITRALVASTQQLRVRKEEGFPDPEYVSAYIAELPSEEAEAAQALIVWLAGTRATSSLDAHLARFIDSADEPGVFAAQVIKRLAAGTSVHERFAARIAHEMFSRFRDAPEFLSAAYVAAEYTNDRELFELITAAEASSLLPDSQRFALLLRSRRFAEADSMLTDDDTAAGLVQHSRVPSELISEFVEYLAATNSASRSLFDGWSSSDTRRRIPRGDW